MEDIIGDACRTKVGYHSLKFALVPALGDTSGHIEEVARNGEEVLSLTSSSRNVVCKVAGIGGLGSSLSNGVVPD